jgi:hypothetical protein
MSITRDLFIYPENICWFIANTSSSYSPAFQMFLKLVFCQRKYEINIFIIIFNDFNVLT